MIAAFYAAAAVAVLSTLLMVTRPSVVHALLYLIVSLLGTAVMFLALGAPFLAALEVIIYAGAVMVLFVFVVMMLNLGPSSSHADWLSPRAWAGPALLAAVLGIELLWILASAGPPSEGVRAIAPARVAESLFGTYLIAVELGSMLLAAGILGAYHLGRRETGRARR